MVKYSSQVSTPTERNTVIQNIESLVFKSEKGNPATSSLLVAEKFGKRHVEVLDAIRGILQNVDNQVVENSTTCKSMFYETSYIDVNGIDRPLFIMNRDGFTLLAMGFTGEKALKFKLDFINAFNEMESKLKQLLDFSNPDTVLMLVQNWKDEQEKRIAAESQVYQQQEIIEIKNDEIKGLLPDAEYARETLRSVSTFTTTQIAKELGMSAKALNRKLCDMKIQFKVNEQWVLHAKYQGKGYTETTTYTETVNDVTKTYHLTVWTEKGRKFIFELLKVEAAA